MGSLNGTLSVIDPGKDVERRQEMSVIVEAQLSQPILQVAIGKFFNSINDKIIAVLHPKLLGFYRLVSGKTFSTKVHATHFII